MVHRNIRFVNILTLSRERRKGRSFLCADYRTPEEDIPENWNHQGDVRGEAGVPFEHLARVGGHAAEDGRHRALGAILRLVGQHATTKVAEQVVMLLLMAIPLTLGVPLHFTVIAVDLASRNIGKSIGAMAVLRDRIPTIWNVSALAVHFGAIGVGELDKVVIEDLAMQIAGPNLSTAHAVG